MAGRLSDGSDNLTFVGTSNGLYVVGLDGKLRHHLYTPFGIKNVTLIGDITGDGIREVVVALNDTQVPALRCYDGATWEKVWQFAPMAKVWDKLWVKRQLPITSLEVTGVGDSQSLVVTSDRCVFSVNAEDGTEHWRFRAPSKLGSMATVADLNNDGADEVFVGSYDGQLFLLNGKTGDLRWRTKLPVISANGSDEPNVVFDIVTLDREAGKVAVVSTDGLARLFDLQSRKCEWAVPVSDDGVSGYRITLAPDATSRWPTGDARDIRLRLQSNRGLLRKGSCSWMPAAEKVWDRKLNVWHDSGVEVGSFGGKPVILEPREQEIRLIDVKDGKTVVKAIPVSTLDDKAPMVQQVGEDRFLLVSSGSDLAVVSASGRRWEPTPGSPTSRPSPGPSLAMPLRTPSSVADGRPAPSTATRRRQRGRYRAGDDRSHISVSVSGRGSRSTNAEGDGRCYPRNRLVIRSPSERSEEQRRIEGNRGDRGPGGQRQRPGHHRLP